MARRGGHPSTLMKITFKLFATLSDYLPPSSRQGNVMELEVPPDASISQIIEPFGLPPRLVHLVLVNGNYVQPEDRLSRTLNDGDTLAIWPPIAGG
jgi:sulfur carrier protein ThiS